LRQPHRRKNEDGPNGAVFSRELELPKRNYIHDPSRAGVDEYHVITPEKVFDPATTSDHDDIGREVIEHDRRRERESN
jgi:hypothetical protein